MNLIDKFFFLFFGIVGVVSGDTSPVPIGLIIDGKRSVGKIAPICIQLALADFYAAHPNYTTRLVLSTRDSSGDVVTAASAAIDLIRNNNVHAVVGPETSAEAAFVSDIGMKAHVPIVSFSATSPSLSPSRHPYFIRTGPGDATQAAPIAALVQAYGWRRAVPIFEDSDYGTGFIPFLVDGLTFVGVTVPYRSQISVTASEDEISEELYKIQTMETRVFIVHMSTSLAKRFFSIAGSIGMMSESYVWIITDGLTSLLRSFDSSLLLQSMQGVLGLKPYMPSTPEYEKFRKRSKLELIKQNPNFVDVPGLSTYGVWAYDTVWALALAAEKIGPTKFRQDVDDQQQQKLKNVSSLVNTVRKNGELFLQTLLNMSFNSVGGRFWINEGERNVTVFQLVNIVGESAKEIGFWTARYGVTRRLNLTSTASYSSTMTSLAPVIWPGEVTTVPKGWTTPTSGKTLKIAVPGPVEAGFHAFLQVDRDPLTNRTVAGGFVIEVFEAAVKRLPYAVPFEYVLYVNGSGKSAGDYTELVKQVYYKRFDAVVGDTTITANRSGFVDFTLPFTVAGVSMVVPTKDLHSKNAWIFLKPLTADLWLASLAFFVLTGVVVWILEHRVNEEFRGPPSHQIGTVFYFTFSTLVFAHKESIVNNLTRFVVIIWVFVVLILQSSYTASLTSMLTVRRVQPLFSDINALNQSKEHVGYLTNSFVKGLLIKQGFDPSRLKPYRSPQQYADALARGSKNGGVAAVVDEVPYLKVFLKDYCSNYSMAGQTLKTAGFGFVFPKGSPLVADLSRAILNLTESDDMTEIEKRWFGDTTGCSSQDSSITSNSLDFLNFWGLFLITGSVSLVAFIVHWIHFCYTNRQALQETSGGSSWRRISSVFKLHDKKDPSSRTFRKSERMKEPATSIDQPSNERYANGSESPFSISNHTYDDDTASFEFPSPHREPTGGEEAVTAGAE